ncbi:MAG: glycosyltransferase [Spirulinaceae cyanobacterium]
MKPTVIIYRDQLIPYSETFIPAQVENLSEYTGFYVGSTSFSNAGAMIPSERSIVLGNVVSSPGIWKTIYKLTGFPHPNWLKSLKKLSPTLMHAHFGLDGLLALPLAQTLDIPLIVTFHGYYATAKIEEKSGKNLFSYTSDYLNRRGQFFREFYGRNRHRLFQEADSFIAVSEFIRSKLIATGCPESKIRVHYIGIDTEKFAPQPEIQKEPIVLFVGRFVEKKGCEYLIKAMAQIQTTFPEVELVLIGDGPLRLELEELAKKSLRRYRFLGVQPSPTVKKWMARSQLLCAPSVTTAQGESEGLPIVILEAMAMGLPVVSSFHAGIPEAVVSGETGFLTPERDWQGIAENISTLLQNKQLREDFASAGRKLATSKFNLQSNSRQLAEIYNEVVAK